MFPHATRVQSVQQECLEIGYGYMMELRARTNNPVTMKVRYSSKGRHCVTSQFLALEARGLETRTHPELDERLRPLPALPPRPRHHKLHT